MNEEKAECTIEDWTKKVSRYVILKMIEGFLVELERRVTEDIAELGRREGNMAIQGAGAGGQLVLYEDMIRRVKELTSVEMAVIATGLTPSH